MRACLENDQASSRPDYFAQTEGDGNANGPIVFCKNESDRKTERACNRCKERGPRTFLGQAVHRQIQVNCNCKQTENDVRRNVPSIGIVACR
jgi:hypothetical protein